MNCPSCACEATEVKDSRPCAEENAIRRRRLCVGCGVRFTTFEMVREEGDALNQQDTFKYKRAAEMRELFASLELDDARLLLGLARKFAGRPAAEAEPGALAQQAAA